MASTTGGFLTGVGLCMLLICFGGIKVMEPFGEMVGRPHLLYRSTHSLSWWDVMSDLDTLAPNATWLADNLGPDSDGFVSSLRQIPEVAHLMDKFYSSSESVYNALGGIGIIPRYRNWIVPMYLAYGMVAGALFFLVGLALIVRPRLRESKLPAVKTFVLAVLAGACIGFGAQLSTAVKVGLTDVAAILRVGSGSTNLLSGAVFSVGLMLVVIGGAELFTGNNLIVAACARRKPTVQGLLKNWAIVYTGNFAGSVLLVLIMFASFYAYRVPGSMGSLAFRIANAKVNLHFVEALSRGIGCNWLVCLAVWLAVSSSDTIGKIFACFFPITAFVAMGLEHSIANMYFITMGLFLKDWTHLYPSAKLTWDGFIRYNLIPVTIGNIIGGALFVGMLYWYAYLQAKNSR